MHEYNKLIMYNCIKCQQAGMYDICMLSYNARFQSKIENDEWYDWGFEMSSSNDFNFSLCFGHNYKVGNKKVTAPIASLDLVSPFRI